MDVLKDLELLIKSRYPLIAVETFEEERLEEVLQQVAARLALPPFVWTITGGLRRADSDKAVTEPQQPVSVGNWVAAFRTPIVNPLYDTQHPLKALRNVDALDTEGIYLFKDLYRYLEEAEVVRKLQDLAQPTGEARIHMVLSAPHILLPAELEKLAAFFRLDLPTTQELRLLTRRVVRDLSKLPPELTRKGRFDEIFFIDLPNAAERREIFAIHVKKRKRNPSTFDLDALAQASEGFSGAEIEQAIVSALYTAFSRSTDLTTPLLLEELQATKPLSVTREEEITALRQWAHGRTVMASAV